VLEFTGLFTLFKIKMYLILRRAGLLLLFCFTVAGYAQGQTAVTGYITDVSGMPVPFANVTIRNTHTGVSADADGYFRFADLAGQQYLDISAIGYQPASVLVSAAGQYRIVLSQRTEIIGDVVVEDTRARETGLSRIDPKLISKIPGTGISGVESSIKTLPGVSSNTELSTQYSVRGGSYDENLIYVNGAKVHRPVLVRNGQQEGLSIINPDLVESLSFSSGGFDASYGGKMSSVLDIKYRRPRQTGGGFDASLMGGSAFAFSGSPDKKLSHITGARYRNTSLLLSSLEEGGRYSPQFFDAQTYLTYKLSSSTELGLLGYAAYNKFGFSPVVRNTVFQRDGQPYSMTIYFNGQEKDSYQSGMLSANMSHSFSESSKLQLMLSHYSSSEKEEYDIDASYALGALQEDGGRRPAKKEDEFDVSGDVIASGSYLSHARNYMFFSSQSAAADYTYTQERIQLRAGVSADAQLWESSISEWLYVDSAGYSIPYSAGAISLNESKRGRADIQTGQAAAFMQLRYSLYLTNADITTVIGGRYLYSHLAGSYLLSPRGRINIKPRWKRDFLFRLSAGRYAQPPGIKEATHPDGSIAAKVPVQDSWHIVAGADHNLFLWGRPFKLVAEAYYKHLAAVIPYTVDNVRIQYRPGLLTSGYATGAEAKLNGEFVKGTESWVSLSLLNTREKNQDGDMQRRPNDRRVNFGMFFQDYFPGNENYKVNLTMYYGSALPVITPSGYGAIAMKEKPSYFRVDLGSSALIFPRKSKEKGRLLHSLWAGLEVFNLLDTYNTASYLWIKDVSGQYWPVPNYLTARRLNVTISGRF
jgi:hypothetical protein